MILIVVLFSYFILHPFLRYTKNPINVFCKQSPKMLLEPSH